MTLRPATRHSLTIFTCSGHNYIQTELFNSPRYQTPLKIVSVRMDVNSVHSPSLAVVASSKVRRVGLSEDKGVLERRVSRVKDDGGRLVLCRGLAITLICSLF